MVRSNFNAGLDWTGYQWHDVSISPRAAATAVLATSRPLAPFWPGESPPRSSTGCRAGAADYGFRRRDAGRPSLRFRLTRRRFWSPSFRKYYYYYYYLVTRSVQKSVNRKLQRVLLRRSDAGVRRNKLLPLCRSLSLRNLALSLIGCKRDARCLSSLFLTGLIVFAGARGPIIPGVAPLPPTSQDPFLCIH